MAGKYAGRYQLSVDIRNIDPQKIHLYEDYMERRDRLAKLLFEFYHGEGTWEDATRFVGPEAVGNYNADADETLHLLPHLLPGPVTDLLPLYTFSRSTPSRK